jgi:glutamyl-tRNA reductase
MYLFAISLRHPNASLEIREQFAISSAKLLQLYTVLKNLQCTLFNLDAVNKQNCIGSFILSTCNRSEIYIYLERSEDIDVVLQTWANFCQNTHINLHNYVNIYCNNDAVNHLFEVMCGLDSMVLGETQIAKQIKDAYTLAHQNHYLNPYLYALLQKTFKCAKEVRTNTNIGKFSISFASAGVRLAQHIFTDLSNQRMLFIGAGDMMHQVIAHFSKHQPKHIDIINRSYDNAQNMAHKRLQNYMGKVDIHGLDALNRVIQQADIIVCCIEYNQILITPDMVKETLKFRKYKPLYLLDLSLPVLMDMNIKKIPDAYLYCIDDLSCIIEDNQSKRIESKHAAQIIIQKHILEFNAWYNHFQLKPLIHKLKLKLQQDMDMVFNEDMYNLIKLNELAELNIQANIRNGAKKMMQRNLHQWLKILPELNTQQQNILSIYLDNEIK